LELPTLMPMPKNIIYLLMPASFNNNLSTFY
jgi:hypothetical protein